MQNSIYIKNGGKTPIAGIVHAAVLLLILVVLMPYAALIPMPTIAAILFVVAFNMCQAKQFIRLIKTASKSDIFVLVLTFLLTIIFALVVAIVVGLVLTCLLFIKRMSDETTVKGWKYEQEDDYENLREINVGIRVFEISGPMFFGMTERIADINAKNYTKVLIIRMRGVPAIDATAMKALEELCIKLLSKNIKIVFSHVNEQPMQMMIKCGLTQKVGEDNFCAHINDALLRAEKLCK